MPASKMCDGEIDVLIGADYYRTLMTEDMIRLNEKLVAIRSKLGYVLSGSINNNEHTVAEETHQTNCVYVMKVVSRLDDEVTNEENKILDEKVEHFWNLDSILILMGEKSAYEETEEKIRFVDGRYQVSLPFKPEHPMVGDNYVHSVKRLKSLKNKLDKTPILLQDYNDIILRQVKEGIVEMIDDTESEQTVGATTYLPHRAVVREGKSSTKVRIVYDASAKAGDCSLNDCLYKGTCLTPLIFDSLLRFRMPNVGIVADIEGAYLQISIAPEDSNYLRFMWYQDIYQQ